MTARRTGPDRFASDAMAATKRIVAAVGTEPDDIAALAKDIARDALAFDEMEAFGRMRKKGSRKLLASTIRVLKKTSKAIDGDPLLGGTAADLSRIRDRLRTFEQWHAAHDRKPVKRGKLIPKWDRPATAIERLCGLDLQQTFEKHFRLRAGFTRKEKQEPVGPVINFIAAALTELGIRYDRKSIVRAANHPEWQTFRNA